MKILTEPFRAKGKIHRPIAAAFLLINAIVLANTLRHDPGIGYDAHAHLAYVEALAGGHLPSPEETYEFFSPPLPYLLPAALRALGLGVRAAARGGLLLNAAMSLLLTWSLASLGRMMRPEDPRLRLGALLLVGTLPVYYKSFSFLRGEPLVAALGLFACYLTARAIFTGDLSQSAAILPGAFLGLALLARQWAVFILAGCATFAMAAVARRHDHRGPCLRRLALSLAVSLALGGWFYAALRATHGSAAAFNRKSEGGFSLSNQPLSFYTDLGLERLFSAPLRGAFPNRLIPIFYAETWGDYWGYFTVYGRNRISGRYLDGFSLDKALEGEPPPEWLETNRFEIAPYLGRVNLVALLPTCLLLAGLLLGGREVLRFSSGRSSGAGTLLFLVIACSAAGYLWFLVSYPVPGRGTTIKATYLLHVFPMAALLAGDLLSRIARRSVMSYRLIVSAVALCGLHNLPMFFTRYVVW